MSKAVITRTGIFDCQVCVPKTYTDEQVLDLVERQYEMRGGVRREGDKMLGGDPERAQCTKYPENCHIVVDV
jgi:hypothetical protein